MNQLKLPELLALNVQAVPDAELTAACKQIVSMRKKLESMVSDLKDQEKAVCDKAYHNLLTSVDLVKDASGTFKIARTEQYSMTGGVVAIQELVVQRLASGMDAVEAFDPTSRLALRATYFKDMPDDELIAGVKKVEVKKTTFTPSK